MLNSFMSRACPGGKGYDAGTCAVPGLRQYVFTDLAVIRYVGSHNPESGMNKSPGLAFKSQNVMHVNTS